jgi:bifunctional non-homologous end joining protein LigD
VDGQAARAFTRNGHDWTEQYRRIIGAARHLGGALTIDGKMVVQDEHGRSDFGAVRSAITHHHRLIFYAFDLLAHRGKDLRSSPLIERRARLEDLIGGNSSGSCIQFSAHVVGNGAAMFEAADRMGLEGIVSKKLSSRYRSGPTKAWLKVKCFAEGEFAVVGVEHGSGPTTLLLARETENGLEYAGGAILTLFDEERGAFWFVADRLQIAGPPLPLPRRKHVTWMSPELRAQVRYLKGSDKLRHATVLRLLP